jgi:HTH-type transcriptional regulator/antitoxin HigA
MPIGAGAMHIRPIWIDEDHEITMREIEALDPVRAIEAAMEMNGYTRAELAALIGQSRATEILSRHRALILPMICKIARTWHVPEKVLVQNYALAKA